MEDLTISEIVSDPMIGLLLKADGIAPAAFAQLLESAARVNGNALRMRRAREENFPMAVTPQWLRASGGMSADL